MKNLVLILFIVSWQLCFGQSAEEYMIIANEKLEAKDYYYALNSIEKSIDANPKDIWNRMLMAEVLLRLDRPREAKEQYEIAIQIDPEASEPYNRLGDFYTSINDLEGSLKCYDSAIKYAKNDTMLFSYHINRASAKGILRDFEGSISDFEKAYQIDSTSMALLNNLATIYHEVGQLKKGIALLKKSIELYPDFLGSYGNLGLIYSEMDSLDVSEYYMKKALELDPEEPLLLNNLGFLYYKKKEHSKALGSINKSINLYPNNSYAYRNRALVYLELGLNKEACRDLEIATFYNFKVRYGDEVEKLMLENCKKD